MSELNENPRSEPELYYGFTESLANRDKKHIYRTEVRTDGEIPLQDLDKLPVSSGTTVPQVGAGEIKHRFVGAHRLAFTIISSAVIIATERLRRGVVNYPRATIATVLSIIVLGGVALTRPSKRTPVAEWSSGQRVVTLTAQNPNNDQSKVDPTVADPGQLSALKSTNPKLLTPAHSNADLDKRSLKLSEAIPLPVKEQFVAVKAAPDEPAFPKTSSYQEVQGDPLASDTMPASEGINMPLLTPAVTPAEDLQLFRERHEQPVLGIEGPRIATTVTQMKAEKPLSGLTSNEGAASFAPVPPKSIQCARAEADSWNGLTHRTAESKDSSTKSSRVPGREAAPIALPARPSITPTQRSKTISVSSAPAAGNPIQPVKTPTVRNAPELHETKPVIASLDETIPKSELSKIGLPNSAVQSKSTIDGRAGKSSDIAPVEAAVEATPGESGLRSAASNTELSGRTSNSNTGVSARSTPAANGTTVPAATVASGAVLANSVKDLSSSTSAPQVGLPTELVESANSLLKRNGENPSVARTQATSVHTQTRTGELLSTPLPISTEKSNQAAIAERNELRELGSESAVGTSSATTTSVPKRSDRPARRVDRPDSVLDRSTVQSDTELSDRSGTLSQSDWVTVPNNEKILENPGSDPESVSLRLESGSLPTRDPQAHADKAVDLELETAQFPMQSRVRNLNQGTIGAAKSSTESDIEHSTSIQELAYTPHVVQRGENFWTISRQYFATGNYWIALWKCNSEKVPEIDRLHVGDVIMIPAIEDLDLAATDPRLSRHKSNPEAGVSMGNAELKSHSLTSPRSTGQSSLVGTASIDRLSRSNNNSNRVAPNQARNLDSGDDEIEQNRHTEHSRVNIESSRPDSIDSDGGERGLRNSARPTARRTPIDKPSAYRIRRYDTIRSIARDMLGDSRRAEEITEINKTIIDDPAQLVVGQLIELPQ